MICLSEKYKTGTLLEVSGRSMEPTLWDGQIVEVMEGYHDGDIVVAEHEGSLIIKRLVGDRLLGDNREISTDFFVVDVRILGQAEVRTKEELEERGVQVNCLHLVKVEAISGTRSAYNIPADANWASPESTDGNYYVYGMRDGRRQWVKGAEQIPEDANWVVPDADNLYYIYGMPNGNVSGTPNALDIPADANWASPDNVYDSFDYYVYSMSNGTINRVQGSGRIPGNANWVVPDADNLYYIYSEKKNQFPTISLSTTNNMTLSQGNCVLSGNVIDSDGDTVTISATISGVTKQTTVTGTGGWSLSWPVIDLAQGQYSNIIITANDGRGGTATVNYTGLITIDKTKPSIAISGVSEGQTYTTATPVFSATDAGGAGLQSCTATLNNNAYTSGTPITIGGNYTLVVTARDRAGNVSTKTVNFKVNSAPTVEVSTANNQTLYEGDSLIISGSANDVNVGNALIVKLKFDEEAEKNILVTTSTGNPQPISYTVTFKNGRLYDAAGNPITPELNKDVVHSFTVYAKDDSGAESAHITRQFMVVPNRNPLIRINPLEPLTSMVPTDTVTISGTVNDPDEGDTVTMEYKLNQGPFQPIAMQGETWSFSISAGDLRDGENIIELKAIDNKGGVTVKRMAIDQTPRIVPVKVSQSRYMILPPKGEMKGLVAWIQRKKGDLQVKGDLSIVATGQPEFFVPMEKTSAELSHALDEDQFIGSVETAGQNVTIKLTETRTDALNSSAAITKIAGVIN